MAAGFDGSYPVTTRPGVFCHRMSSDLEVGDRIFVNKFMFDGGDVARGDVIVFANSAQVATTDAATAVLDYEGRPDVGRRRGRTGGPGDDCWCWSGMAVMLAAPQPGIRNDSSS